MNTLILQLCRVVHLCDIVQVILSTHMHALLEFVNMFGEFIYGKDILQRINADWFNWMYLVFLVILDCNGLHGKIL